jgi:hypothetical protein
VLLQRGWGSSKGLLQLLSTISSHTHSLALG